MAIVNNKTGETRAVGLVLHVRGTFRLDTSMDEVMVWNRDTKNYSVEYLCGDWFATVDANDEVLNEYRQSIQDQIKRNDELDAIEALKCLRVGATVKVIKGRKIKIGTIAKVLRIIQGDHYEMVFLDNGLVTYSNNLDIEFNGEFIAPLFRSKYKRNELQAFRPL